MWTSNMWFALKKSGDGSKGQEHQGIAYNMANTEAAFLILRLQNDIQYLTGVVDHLLNGVLEHSKSTIDEDIFDKNQLTMIVDRANKQLAPIGKKIGVSMSVLSTSQILSN